MKHTYHPIVRAIVHVATDAKQVWSAFGWIDGDENKRRLAVDVFTLAIAQRLDRVGMKDLRTVGSLQTQILGDKRVLLRKPQRLPDLFALCVFPRGALVQLTHAGLRVLALGVHVARLKCALDVHDGLVRVGAEQFDGLHEPGFGRTGRRGEEGGDVSIETDWQHALQHERVFDKGCFIDDLEIGHVTTVILCERERRGEICAIV